MCSEKPTDKHSAPLKVLAFHKLLARLSFGSTNYSPKRLDRLLSRLLDKGYELSSYDKAIEAPEKRLVLTFDDGYAHLTGCLPQLIEKYGLTPVVFVPTAYLGRSNTWDYSNLFRTDSHLDRAGIKKLSAAGVEFGSHGHSHQPLTRLSDSAAGEELSRSKQILEDITGKEVAMLSYPFGRVDRRIIDAAQSTGFACAFTMAFPTQNDHALARGRYPVYFYDTPFTVGQKLSGGRFYRFEQFKATATNRLSGGTSLYYRLIGKRRES